VTDVGLDDAVFESGRLEDDVFVHKDKYSRSAKNGKVGGR
jgi:hypothetical protein